MRTVKLLMSTTHWPVSWLIRSISWSSWSHMAIIDGDTVIQAKMLDGVVRTPLADAIAAAARYAIIEVPANDPDAVIAAAASQLGKPYDYLGVIGLGLHRDWQEESAWWCSELPAWAFAQAGEPIFRADSIRRIAPQHWWLLWVPNTIEPEIA